MTMCFSAPLSLSVLVPAWPLWSPWVVCIKRRGAPEPHRPPALRLFSIFGVFATTFVYNIVMSPPAVALPINRWADRASSLLSFQGRDRRNDASVRPRPCSERDPSVRHCPRSDRMRYTQVHVAWWLVRTVSAHWCLPLNQSCHAFRSFFSRHRRGRALSPLTNACCTHSTVRLILFAERITPLLYLPPSAHSGRKMRAHR